MSETVAVLTNEYAHAIALFERDNGFSLCVGNIAANMIRGSAKCLEDDLREDFGDELTSFETVEGSVPGRWDIWARFSKEVGRERLMRFIREDLEGEENQAAKQ